MDGEGGKEFAAFSDWYERANYGEHRPTVGLYGR
jgi:hypothetical protein